MTKTVPPKVTTNTETTNESEATLPTQISGTNAKSKPLTKQTEAMNRRYMKGTYS